MLSHGKRPRELHWYHAGPMLFGDWGTSRLYVLGLALAFTQHASLWFMLAMSFLLIGVGWAYQVICRLFPTGGGVYSSARERSHLLAVVGALLLCADYVVTASLSALDAFHYIDVPYPALWAAGSILLVGVINYFGPKKAGTVALFIALFTVVLTLVIAIFALPHVGEVRVEAPTGSAWSWWRQFTQLILAISGVEAIANMTGIMVEPVEQTSRKAIWPVLIEIVILNLVLTLAMNAMPLDVLGDGDPANAYRAHRDDMLRVIAEYYVGHSFAAVASIVFALLLLSAVNTAVTDLVSIQYMMSRDKELPVSFSGLNSWGMPVIPLLVGTLIPAAVVLAVPDVEHLADLYAIGVVGAVALNLGTCSTNFRLDIKSWERGGMMLLSALMVLIWLTIAWEKPFALAFALSIMLAGMLGRYVAHHWQAIQARIRVVLPAPEMAPIGEAPEVVPAYKPECRILVATRGNPRLLHFALDQAKLKHGELLVLYVRHIAVTPVGDPAPMTVEEDPEAWAMFQMVKKMAAEKGGVPVRLIYTEATNIAEVVLDLAVTYGVDSLILGSTQRGALWRALKGDVIQQVALYLPEKIPLLIHA